MDNKIVLMVLILIVGVGMCYGCTGWKTDPTTNISYYEYYNEQGTLVKVYDPNINQNMDVPNNVVIDKNGVGWDNNTKTQKNNTPTTNKHIELNNYVTQ